MEQTLITIFDRYKFFLDFNFLIEETKVVIEETKVVIEEMPIANAFSGIVIADRRLKTVNGDRGGHDRNPKQGYCVGARDLDPRVLREP